MKYSEIIADNLKKAGWNCGSISSTDDEGQQFWVVAAEREDAGRFVVQAYEKLTAPLVAYYRKHGWLYEIDASKSVAEVEQEIEQAVASMCGAR